MSKTHINPHTHRFVARLVIETTAPLSVGSGNTDLAKDKVIARDANDLPYIPGATLAGILRHHTQPILKKDTDSVFGFADKDHEGHGSRLSFSPAYLTDNSGNSVYEGIADFKTSEQEYLGWFKNLPLRDHVRINHKGTAQNHGKFDEEILYAGARFAFRMEMEGNVAETNKGDEIIWEKLLKAFQDKILRIGSGSRNGFGSFDVKLAESYQKSFDLTDLQQCTYYLNLDAGVNFSCKGFDAIPENKLEPEEWVDKTLVLKAQDFFMFGAGFGHESLEEDKNKKPHEKFDAIEKQEDCIVWGNSGPELKKNVLIPATSVKGALSHRVAFHYNKITGNRIDSSKSKIELPKYNVEVEFAEYNKRFEKLVAENTAPDSEELKLLIAELEAMKLSPEGDDHKLKNLTVWNNFVEEAKNQEKELQSDESDGTGVNNEAVCVLFGYSKMKDGKLDMQAGNLIIADHFIPEANVKHKKFDHVAINPFTGGAQPGALFSERTVNYDSEIALPMWVKRTALKDKDVEDALNKALNDLCDGQLALGGHTTKGHGAFTLKND